MRNRVILLMTALLSAAAAVAHAQSSGSTDVGLRLSSVRGDEARFQRFRDIGDGAVMERVRFERGGHNWLFSVGADHVGRRDQRYTLAYRTGGKLTMSFLWDQIPLFISRDTRTLFSLESPGVFRLDDAIQRALEANPLQLANFAPGASGLDVRSRRDTAAFELIYSATRDLDVKVNLKSVRREGSMPWGLTFGHTNVVELAAPIDTRTTDVTVGVEWANRLGSLRVGYDGSIFSNRVPTLVWDNPWRFTDSPTAGSSQGWAALPPGSTLHSVTTAGGLKLPARSRLTGNVTIGTWRQNEALLPFTINSALLAPPLDRQTAQADARTLAMNYTLTSRPARIVWLNARYRYYDFDNRTPPFTMPTRVRLDQTIVAVPLGGPETFSSTRHNLDLDASMTPVTFSAFRVGYGRELVDRTHRIFGRTMENVFRTSADTTIGPLVMVRGLFEHARREGSRFHEEALTAIGEQPALRHFDVADRDRDRVTALLQVTPVPAIGMTASVARGKDEYRNSGFGLRDSDTRSYAVALDFLPHERVNASLSFVRDTYSALQTSRSAAPGVQFVDPSRNWSVDSGDHTRTLTASLDLLRMLPETELRFAYDISRSRSTYVYVLPAGGTLPPPSQLPPVINRLQSGTADLRYFLTPRAAVGLVYWFDAYRVDDFALGPGTLTQINLPGNSLYLGSLYRPYTAHAASLRLTYLW
jgi:MtrB/PioB family decaheme-associated outer membrane protein